MNGYASNISRDACTTTARRSRSKTTAAAFRSTSIRRPKKSALEVIFTVLHAGGKFEHGNYKTAGGLHGVGASVVNALSKELVATVKRDGAQWEMRFKQGKPVGAAEEARAGARHRHDGLLPSRRGDLPEDRVRPGGHQGAARGRQLPAQGRSRSPSRTKAAKEKLVFEHTEGLVDYLRKIVAERGAKPVHDAPFTLRARTTACGSISSCSGPRRPTSTSARYVNGIPDRIGRHARERPARRHRQGGAQLHRDAQPLAERRHADRRRHPRRA